MKAFASKKAVWWSVGILVVVVGFFVAVLVLPGTSAPYGADSPNVNVPGMKNIPSRDAPNLELETEEE